MYNITSLLRFIRHNSDHNYRAKWQNSGLLKGFEDEEFERLALYYEATAFIVSTLKGDEQGVKDYETMAFPVVRRIINILNPGNTWAILAEFIRGYDVIPEELFYHSANDVTADYCNSFCEEILNGSRKY